MKLRSVLDLPCGMRAVFSNLELSSSISGHILLEKEMFLSADKIQSHYNQFSLLIKYLSAKSALSDVEKIKMILSGLRDIRNTLSAVAAGKVPDDIELFEIKSLAMITQSVRPLLNELSEVLPGLPDLSKVVELLDPDNLRIPSYYIYDSYDPELSEIGRDFKNAKEFSEDLYTECSKIEDRVRGELAKELRIILKT